MSRSERSIAMSESSSQLLLPAVQEGEEARLELGSNPNSARTAPSSSGSQQPPEEEPSEALEEKPFTWQVLTEVRKEL